MFLDERGLKQQEKKKSNPLQLHPHMTPHLGFPHHPPSCILSEVGRPLRALYEVLCEPTRKRGAGAL